jgi:hypothetical protein
VPTLSHGLHPRFTLEVAMKICLFTGFFLKNIKLFLSVEQWVKLGSRLPLNLGFYLPQTLGDRCAIYLNTYKLVEKDITGSGSGQKAYQILKGTMQFNKEFIYI